MLYEVITHIPVKNASFAELSGAIKEPMNCAINRTSMPARCAERQENHISIDARITSYNVCYTKLLRKDKGTKVIVTIPIRSEERRKLND